MIQSDPPWTAIISPSAARRNLSLKKKGFTKKLSSRDSFETVVNYCAKCFETCLTCRESWCSVPARTRRSVGQFCSHPSSGAWELGPFGPYISLPGPSRYRWGTCGQAQLGFGSPRRRRSDYREAETWKYATKRLHLDTVFFFTAILLILS